MPRHLLLVMLLAAVSPAARPAPGYDFPVERRQGMVAHLHVQVADEPDAAGFARVRLTVRVEGPATLEVESPQLGDSTNAWQTERTSAWRSADGTVAWEETLNLRQVKPGVVPIPSVKLRCRESTTAAWEEVEWTNILTDISGLALPTVPAPTPPFRLWWLWAGALPAGALLVVGAVLWRRSRRVPCPTLTPEERTLAELERLEKTLSHVDHDPREFHESLSMLLRRYVAERFALPAPRQTTAEFLEKVREATAIGEDERDCLRAFLERCDLVKFAGVSPTVEESQERVNFVRTFIHASEQFKQPSEAQETQRREETHRA